MFNVSVADVKLPISIKCSLYLDAPELSGNLFDQWILVGTTVAFDCQVDRANPMPSVSWRKDGQLLRSVLGNRLIINNVNTSDEGTYACTAENVVGSSSLAATLRIVGKIFTHDVVSS